MIVPKEDFETWLEEVTCKELEYEDVFLDCDRERDWDELEVVEDEKAAAIEEDWNDEDDTLVVVEDEREAAKEDEEEDEEDK